MCVYSFSRRVCRVLSTSEEEGTEATQPGPSSPQRQPKVKKESKKAKKPAKKKRVSKGFIWPVFGIHLCNDGVLILFFVIWLELFLSVVSLLQNEVLSGLFEKNTNNVCNEVVRKTEKHDVIHSCFVFSRPKNLK